MYSRFKVFPEMLAATPGGRSELRELVDSRFQDLIDALPDSQPRASFAFQMATNRSWGIDLNSWYSIFRVYATSGQVAGYVWIGKPAAGAGKTVLGTAEPVGGPPAALGPMICAHSNAAAHNRPYPSKTW